MCIKQRCSFKTSTNYLDETMLKWTVYELRCLWTTFIFYELLYPPVHTFHLSPSIHSSIYLSKLSINLSVDQSIYQLTISSDLLYQIVCPSIRLSLLSREHRMSRYILCFRVCSMMYLAKKKVVRSDRLAFYCAEFDGKKAVGAKLLSQMNPWDDVLVLKCWHSPSFLFILTLVPVSSNGE